MDEQEWQQAKLEGVLEISVPATMSASIQRGFESPVGVWEGDGISVVIDATPHADPLTPQSAPRDANTSTEIIDGHPTRVVSYVENDRTHVVAARLEPTGSSRGVTIVVRAGPEVAHGLPLRIIRSVRLAG